MPFARSTRHRHRRCGLRSPTIQAHCARPDPPQWPDPPRPPAPAHASDCPEPPRGEPTRCYLTHHHDWRTALVTGRPPGAVPLRHSQQPGPPPDPQPWRPTPRRSHPTSTKPAPPLAPFSTLRPRKAKRSTVPTSRERLKSPRRRGPLSHLSRRIRPRFLLLIRPWRPPNERNRLLLTSRPAVGVPLRNVAPTAN